jgi:hypothetical protein
MPTNDDFGVGFFDDFDPDEVHDPFFDAAGGAAERIEENREKLRKVWASRSSNRRRLGPSHERRSVDEPVEEALVDEEADETVEDTERADTDSPKTGPNAEPKSGRGFKGKDPRAA